MYCMSKSVCLSWKEGPRKGLEVTEQNLLLEGNLEWDMQSFVSVSPQKIHITLRCRLATLPCHAHSSDATLW